MRDPKAIKIALIRAGKTQADIAKTHQVTPSAVSQVINQKARSAKIERELEDILKVWGAAL